MSRATNGKQRLLGAFVTGLVGASLTVAVQADEPSKQFECKGGNACKGKGDCGGPGYGCAGNNECRGKGWVYTESKEECDKLVAKVNAGGKNASGKSKKAK